MRFITLVCLALIVTVAGLASCNSSEALISQAPKGSPTPQQVPPGDTARRIKAAELHELWEKGDVVIIDTRAESAYKEEHIKGALSMPAGTVLSHLEELPKNKMIVAYCT